VGKSIVHPLTPSHAPDQMFKPYRPSFTKSRRSQPIQPLIQARVTS
jgi:hypothetical protein